jgi:hypothetical protein
MPSLHALIDPSVNNCLCASQVLAQCMHDDNQEVRETAAA